MKLLIFALLIQSFSAIAQMRISLNTGYGMYAMKEMKSFQAELMSQATYPMHITESFPGYAFHEGSLTIPVGDELFFAAKLGYSSTGGRIHYSDYSGEYRFDQLLNCMSAGTSVGFSINNPTRKYVFNFSLTPSVALTRLDLRFLARIGDAEALEKFKFGSTNLTLQPDISITRKIGRLGLQAMLGYNFGIVKGKMYLTSNSEAFLINSSGNDIPANWDGARISMGVSYSFGE